MPQWQVPSIWFCSSRPSSSGRVGGPRTELGQCIYSEAARKCRWPWSQLYVEGVIPVSTASDTHATMWILWVNPFSLFHLNGLWTFSFSKLISEQTACMQLIHIPFFHSHACTEISSEIALCLNLSRNYLVIYFLSLKLVPFNVIACFTTPMIRHRKF